MRKHVLFLLTMLVAGNVASAQTISIGVIGGVSLLAPASSRDESRRFIVGPSIEFRLPAGFAIEADALYQRIGNSTGISNPQGVNLTKSLVTQSLFSNRQRGNDWE
ncbi:MAG: hypothetical protein ACRD4P_14695, partial [Bryobacteraceae bacterium]